MNFPLIKQVIDWLMKHSDGIPWITSCSTNGTLVSGDIKRWLKENKKWIVPSLSYDGSGSMQNANRGTDRLSIDLPFFLETWPKQNVHMTVSKRTLPSLSEGVLALQRKGGGLDVALAQGEDWNREDADCFLTELRKLASAYLDDPKLKPINLLSRPLFGVSSPESEQKKFCGTGGHMIAYDVDGKSYPCHLFTPLVLGPEKAVEISAAGFAQNCSLTDPECSGCTLRHWCPTCCGFNYRFRGNPAKRDRRWCDMVRAEAIATCEFQIAFYHKHRSEIGDEDLSPIKAVLQAYEALSADRESSSPKLQSSKGNK